MTTYYTYSSVADYLDRLINNLTVPENSPWEKVPNFPPVEISYNSKTQEGRFRFALAGIDKDSLDLEFTNDQMVLTFQKVEKTEDDWKIIRSSIKQPSGYVKYPISFEKFDIDNAKAVWDDGVLAITIPLRENQKPKKLLIN